MNYPTPHQFIYITNAGAHFSVTAPAEDSERKALHVLLKNSVTPKLTVYLTELKSAISGSSFQHVITLFNKGYICAKDHSTELKEQSLEVSLPSLLAKLSSRQHCILCDQEGFLIAHAGFTGDEAEQAAAVAIEISGLQEKRQHNLNQFSHSSSSFISITDSDGNTEMQFLPLHYAQYNSSNHTIENTVSSVIKSHHIFILAIQGQALLQQESFTQLIWLLGQRYL